MGRLIYEKDGHIATITFNRPEAKNAMDPQTIVDLVESLEDFDKDDNLRVAIITGGAGAEIECLPYRGDFHHHLFLSVHEDDVQVAVIKTGSIHKQELVTYSQVKLVDEFLESVSMKSLEVSLGEPFKNCVRLIPG